jgi:putative transposase
MIVFEAKLKGTDAQYAILHQVLRTARFVRNSCLRYWMDNPGLDKYDLNNYCTVLAKEYPWAKKLNSMARQASAERAWSSFSRFYENCKAKKTR